MPNLPWITGGARGGDRLPLKNGDQYLVCVQIEGRLGDSGPFLDWHVVEVKHGVDGVVFHSNGWTWQWDDVSFCLPLGQLKLPEDAT
jgi:hypothetical protein